MSIGRRPAGTAAGVGAGREGRGRACGARVTAGALQSLCPRPTPRGRTQSTRRARGRGGRGGQALQRTPRHIAAIDFAHSRNTRPALPTTAAKGSVKPRNPVAYGRTPRTASRTGASRRSGA